ncbi:MAG: hypothetical protein WCW02_03185 [Candidatus Buchananbacteria bacterium]
MDTKFIERSKKVILFLVGWYCELKQKKQSLFKFVRKTFGEMETERRFNLFRAYALSIGPSETNDLKLWRKWCDLGIHECLVNNPDLYFLEFCKIFCELRMKCDNFNSLIKIKQSLGLILGENLDANSSCKLHEMQLVYIMGLSIEPLSENIVNYFRSRDFRFNCKETKAWCLRNCLPYVLKYDYQDFYGNIPRILKQMREVESDIEVLTNALAYIDKEYLRYKNVDKEAASLVSGLIGNF